MLFLIKVIKLMWHLVWLPIYAIALLLELTRDKCRAILILMQDNENAPVIKTISYIIQMFFVFLLLPFYIIGGKHDD